MAEQYRLEMIGVSKSFPGVKALDGINLKVRPGTVHALMGENGAGKSTLMKCLFGIYKMDEGQIIIDGEKTEITNPDDALRKGLAMVHQELQPIPDCSIAENMYLGRYPMKSVGPLKMVDHKTMNSEAEKWLKDVKMNFDPKAKLGTLSIGQMQSVEIAKAVSQHAKIVILDEATASIDPENEAMIQKAMVMPRSNLAKPCRQQRRNVIKAIVNSGICATRIKLVASEIRFAAVNASLARRHASTCAA